MKRPVIFIVVALGILLGACTSPVAPTPPTKVSAYVVAPAGTIVYQREGGYMYPGRTAEQPVDAIQFRWMNSGEQIITGCVDKDVVWDVKAQTATCIRDMTLPVDTEIQLSTGDAAKALVGYPSSWLRGSIIFVRGTRLSAVVEEPDHRAYALFRVDGSGSVY